MLESSIGGRYDQYEQLPALASDLVARGVSVIATLGSSPAASPRNPATSVIPIFLAVGVDSVTWTCQQHKPTGWESDGAYFLVNTFPAKQN
jgi:hypothetical protein